MIYHYVTHIDGACVLLDSTLSSPSSQTLKYQAITDFGSSLTGAAVHKSNINI